MARVKLEHPIAEVHGVFTRDGLINRQKKYYDSRGRVLCEGKQEMYAIRNPRDFKKNPPKGAELEHHNRWKEACHRTSQILQAAQVGGPTESQLFARQLNNTPEYYTIEEAKTLYLSYWERYNAQLPGKRGKRPDPSASIDQRTGKGKRYSQLPSFIRAIIYNELKTASSTPNL